MSWSEKLLKDIAIKGAMAPEWYIEMKKCGANQRVIREAVKDFCIKSIDAQTVDEALVDLMIQTYEL